MTAQLWNGDDTAWWVLLAAAVVVAFVALGVAFIATARAAMWKGRCQDRDATIAELRDALDDRRFDPGERRNRALPLGDWATPGQPRRKARPTTRRGWWPGGNAGRLNVNYGPTEPPLRAIPATPAAVAPTEKELHVWLAEERLVDAFYAHLETVDTATCEMQATTTRELEVVR